MRLVVVATCSACTSSGTSTPRVCTAPTNQPTLDRFGGLLGTDLPAGALFTVGSWHGASWLVTPDGHPFYSFGVSVVGPDGDVSPATGRSPYGDTVASHYASKDEWAHAAIDRLAGWGLNTLGAWSDAALFAAQPTRVPYTAILDLGRPTDNSFVPDFFDPAFAAHVAQTVNTLVQPRVGDPWLVGWFLDNELHWGPDYRDNNDLMGDYMRLPAAAPGKQHVVDTLLARHGGDVKRFDDAWGTTFATRDELLAASALPNSEMPVALADRSAIVRAIADQYFQVTISAVRAVDPGHLILGCRFVSWTLPNEVLAAAAAAPLDVVSVNHYELDPLFATVAQSLSNDFVTVGPGIDAIVPHAGHPVLISEFAYRAADSGLPNNNPGIMPVLDTQAERANAYEHYVDAALAIPGVVGLHWFQWVDEPGTGRFDGENSNWGLVNTDDAPYEPLVDRMACVAARVADLHRH
jgi:agarase